jgi:hypothetical protein
LAADRSSCRCCGTPWCRTSPPRAAVRTRGVSRCDERRACVECIERVGILGAALYNPVCTTAIRTLADIGTAVIGFLLLERLRVAPLAVVAIFLFVAVIRHHASLA